MENGYEYKASNYFADCFTDHYDPFDPSGKTKKTGSEIHVIMAASGGCTDHFDLLPEIVDDSC